MFLDGRSGEVPDRIECDLAIVGAGPAGITLARELAGAGLDIVMIESGGLEFDGDTQELYEGPVEGPGDVDLTAIRLRLFGGASGHWGGQCLPLDDIDFERAPPGLSGWPFAKSELLPFYEIACRYCEVGPARFDPVELGVTEDLQPLANDAQIGTSVVRQSPPTRFGEVYREAMRDQPGLRVLLWTNVTGAEFGASGEVASVITRTLSGRMGQVAARRVVIACGAVETARLLLQINADTEQRLGDAGDLLGRCYMDHPAGGAGVVHLRRPVAGWPYWNRELFAPDGIRLRAVLRPHERVLAETGRANAQFFLVPWAQDPEVRRRTIRANRGAAALRDIAKWTVGRGLPGRSLSEAYCTAIQNTDALVARLWEGASSGDVTTMFVRYEAEQWPDRSSHVSLDGTRDALGQWRARLTWAPTVTERESLIENAVALGAAFGAKGLGHLELSDEFESPTWLTNTAWHQIGTTRMARAPKDGVLDPDGRVFGSRNLYCVGASMMPTGGRANPTLTLVALAARMAAHLRQLDGG